MLSIPTVLSLAALAGAVATSARDAAVDYGFWNVNVSGVDYANGYQTQTVTAVWSLAPDNTSTCNYIYRPLTGTTTCDPDTFSYSFGGTIIEVSQQVEFEGASVNLTGSSPMEVQNGLGGNSEGYAGSAVVNATLVTSG